MFGSLRLTSQDLERVHSVSARGKHCVYLQVHCVCTECGAQVTPLWDNVKSGKTTRCKSCAQKAAAKNRQRNAWRGRTPDEVDQWLRCKWFSIRGRCEDPVNRQYGNYGARGIRLSEEFRDPLVFIEYMRSIGDPDDAFRRKLEIDRIDNDKGYERGNLRWATRGQQANNTRNTIYVTFRNERMCFSDFVANYTTLSRSRAYMLYRTGVPLEQITQVKGRGPRKPRNPGV